MQAKILIILAIMVVFLTAIVGTPLYFLLKSQLNKSGPVQNVADNLFGWKLPVAKFPKLGSGDQVAYSSIRDPGGIPEGLPVRLQIPVINVDSTIEDALITPDGRMDVPAGSADVAWFALGPQPGQIGSAVIGGHFGMSNGVPWVFYNLDKVKVGDKIFIIDDKDSTLGFVVRSIKSFDRNADATAVFTSDDGLAHLNLITCEGTWNQVNGTYPQRLVVFTDAILPTNTTVTPTPIVVTFNRSLSIGSKGEDVVILQDALSQKGFLAIPPGVSKGKFGALTYAAVIKYQKSVGLPASGFFGPLTRAKLTTYLTSTSILPNAGKPGVVFINSAKIIPSLVQVIIQSIKSLYTTAIDGFITSLLLVLVVIAAFKIILLVNSKKQTGF